MHDKTKSEMSGLKQKIYFVTSFVSCSDGEKRLRLTFEFPGILVGIQTTKRSFYVFRVTFNIMSTNTK